MLILVERKSTSYEWTFGLTTYLIVLLNGTVTGISIDDFSDRMSVSLTLLLTLVAQKFVSSQSVPSVDYNTLLDWYCNAALLWLAAGMLEMFIVRSECCQSEDADIHFHAILSCLWTLCHIVFMIMRGRLRVSWDKVPDQYKRDYAIGESRGETLKGTGKRVFAVEAPQRLD
jgi:hypothetical protein